MRRRRGKLLFLHRGAGNAMLFRGGTDTTPWQAQIYLAFKALLTHAPGINSEKEKKEDICEHGARKQGKEEKSSHLFLFADLSIRENGASLLFCHVTLLSPFLSPNEDNVVFVSLLSFSGPARDSIFLHPFLIIPPNIARELLANGPENCPDFCRAKPAFRRNSRGIFGRDDKGTQNTKEATLFLTDLGISAISHQLV